MKTYLLLRVFLALHIAGLVVMAGTTLMDYITFSTFWKLADKGNERAFGLLPMMANYGEWVRTGAAILFATGFGMLIIETAVWKQNWFKIKLVLVLALVLNGVLVGNKQGIRFRDMMAEQGPDFMQQAAAIRGTLNRFYLMQLVFFLAIILLSVVRLDKR